MYVVLLYIVIHTDIKICFVEPNGCCEYCELNNQPKVLLSFDYSSDMSEICLRIRPVDCNVVCSSVAMLKRMTRMTRITGSFADIRIRHV